MVFSALRGGKSVRSASTLVAARQMPLGRAGLLFAVVAVVVVMGLAMLAFVSLAGL
jgi:hypothetical protein